MNNKIQHLKMCLCHNMDDMYLLSNYVTGVLIRRSSLHRLPYMEGTAALSQKWLQNVTCTLLSAVTNTVQTRESC